MKVLLTGACGFVGSAIAQALLDLHPDWEIVGLDNFIRPGSETNREMLRQRGVSLVHGDVRTPSDLEPLPAADWVIDAAANPSVLAGVDGKSSSRQVVEHNLLSTVNLLEYCRKHQAGFLLLSTSRVYSIAALSSLPMENRDERFRLAEKKLLLVPGISIDGVAENFSVAPPVSLYGATKLASEILALEYAETLGLPVWVNRCGVMAGAGQFGRADQGIVAYWINSYLRREKICYIGFGGTGHQVRDAIHPRDVALLLALQMKEKDAKDRPRVVNVGGGNANSFSLSELSAWCAERFGFTHAIGADPKPRNLDLPWMVMDNALVKSTWKWQSSMSLPEILEEVAAHAEAHPDWLRLSAPLS